MLEIVLVGFRFGLGHVERVGENFGIVHGAPADKGAVFSEVGSLVLLNVSVDSFLDIEMVLLLHIQNMQSGLSFIIQMQGKFEKWLEEKIYFVKKSSRNSIQFKPQSAKKDLASFKIQSVSNLPFNHKKSELLLVSKSIPLNQKKKTKIQSMKSNRLSLFKSIPSMKNRPVTTLSHISIQRLKQNCQKAQSKELKITLLKVDRQRQIKAYSFIVVDSFRNVLLMQRCKVQLEIASLTKIMTCFLVLRLAAQFSIEISSCKVVITKHVLLRGTTAGLCVGDELTVQQLLYGLMLPSGNDAAQALAVWGGKLLGESKINKAIQTFVQKMNATAKQIGMQRTRFENAHGLSHQLARSTAFDMSLLCLEAVKHTTFLKIIKVVQRRVFIFNSELQSGRQLVWKNTNKLLKLPGFSGIKTGITAEAGPCLATYYQGNRSKLIVILLRTTTLSLRFKQSQELVRRALQSMGEWVSRMQTAESQSFQRIQFDYSRNDKCQFDKRMAVLSNMEDD